MRQEDAAAPSSPTVLVVGPGAIGRVLAARWALAGLRVLLLGRTAAREASLARRGIVLTLHDGRNLTARGFRSARRRRPSACAAVFLCVKSSDLPVAVRAARPWVGPGTPVVALQNGLRHPRLVRRAFGSARAVIGSCYVAAQAGHGGTVRHWGGRAVRLAADARNRRCAAEAADLLRRGGWDVPVLHDEDRMLWTKLVVNASVNLLGTAAGVTNGDLARLPALAGVFDLLLAEGSAVARAAGHPPLDPLRKLVPAWCLNSPDQSNSTLQDLRAGRRTEIDAIIGPMLAAAYAHRVKIPALELLGRVVRGLEAGLRGRRPCRATRGRRA